MNQLADDFNQSGQFGRIACFFHCCVAGWDFILKCPWRTGQSWCQSILQRGTAAAGIWHEVIEPLIAAEIGQHSDGYVDVNVVKHRRKDLEPYGEMRPILDFLSLGQQRLLAEFVKLRDLADHLQPAGQFEVRRAYIILVQDKFSVAVTQFGWEHVLHWDPHAATPEKADQSITVVARSGAELTTMMVKRGVYHEETCCSLFFGFISLLVSFGTSKCLPK